MSSEVRFGGIVDGHGKLRLDRRHEFDAYIERFAGLRVSITVSKEKTRRTNPQNKRAWTRIVNGVRAHWYHKHSVRLSKQQVWSRLKYKYLGCDDTPLGPEPKESKTLSPAEFADLMDTIEADFATEEGVNLSEVPPIGDEEDD